MFCRILPPRQSPPEDSHIVQFYSCTIHVRRNIVGKRTLSYGAAPPSRVGHTTSPGESGDTNYPRPEYSESAPHAPGWVKKKASSPLLCPTAALVRKTRTTRTAVRTTEGHITVISNVRGDVETFLDTFPGMHFPVTRSTAGADGSCRLSDRTVLLVGTPGGLTRCRTTCRMSFPPNTAGKSSFDMTSSDLTRVSAPSE